MLTDEQVISACRRALGPQETVQRQAYQYLDGEMVGGLFDKDHQALGLLPPVFGLRVKLIGRGRPVLLEEGGYSE